MRVSVLALVALLAAVVAAGWAPDARAHRSLAPIHGAASVDAAAGDVRVIVSLESSPSLRGDRARLRDDVAERTERVRVGLPARARVLSTQRVVPSLVVSIPAGELQSLAAHPDIAAIAVDTAVYADLDQTLPMINADDVHTSLGVTGAGVTVAVLDTGADTDHPALAGDIGGQACFLIGGGCPVAAGVADPCPVIPGNTFSGFAEDGHGHGTHVSGIVTSAGHAGLDQGIAPGATVKAFKVLSDCGQGDVANIINAYDEILESHDDVDVINMSIGDGTSNAPGTCDGRIPAMTAAVEIARASGIISFGSSGNTASKTGIGYPGCISAVVSVGAVYDAAFPILGYTPCTDTNTVPDEVTCFSQSGPDLDLLAPGALVESSFVGGGFANLAGTSMASPAAAAVAALMLDDEALLTPALIESRLKLTGIPITDTANGVSTCRIDAFKAVSNIGPLCLALPTDTDGDGCSDAEEGTSTEVAGGVRDALDPWDFFDVTGDAAIDLGDTLDVLGFFGDAGAPATPGNLRDRVVPDDLQPWRTAESDDGVDLADALANLRSFGHDCSGPP